MPSNIKQTIAHRFGLVQIKEHILERRVAETPWYHGDGAALAMLLTIQIVTGITMTLSYSNAANYAYESVRQLTEKQAMGWLVRGIHYWSAGIMVVMLFLHLFRQLLVGGYKAPREGTWTIGVFQFFLVLTMAFSGYVLRWDERGLYAAAVVLNMFHKVPVIGGELALLVQGGPELGSLTLTRFFSIHTFIVPLLLVGFVSFHLYLVILHGVSSWAERGQEVGSAEDLKRIYEEAAQSEHRGEWFHPDTVLRSGLMAFAAFCVAFLLALLAGPQELYPEASLVARSMPQEEWWFWWYSSLIARLPRLAVPIFVVGFPIVLLAGMLLLPLLDRSPNRGIQHRPVWTAVVVVTAISLLVLSAWRMRSPWTGWPDPSPPPLPAGVTLAGQAEDGRQLFARYGCNSCHAIAGHGRQVGPDLARLEHRLSQDELRNYILAPEAGVPMPSYRRRLSADDLERIVAFVLAAQTFPRE